MGVGAATYTVPVGFKPYLVMPVVNSSFGRMSFPSSSFAGRISNFASSVATIIQTLANPRYWPGQILFLTLVDLHRDTLNGRSPSTKPKLTSGYWFAIPTF